MLVYGPLEKATFELLAADPATVLGEGRVYYNTVSDLVKWYTGAVWKTAVDLDSTQTMTGKTLTAPVIDDYFDINEESAPGTPGAGKVRVYAKTDKKLYKKDSTGTESSVGGTGSGEINNIDNPDDAGAGWTASGAGITVATTSTANELPLAGVTDTAIKITPVSSTDYVYYRWTMPEALKGKKLKVEFFQRALSSYATGDLKILVFKNAASNYGGAYTEFTLSTHSSGVSGLPAITGKYTTTFDADTADYYELRIQRVAGTSPLSIVNVVVGPGIQPQGASVSEWLSFTPTGSWVSNATYTGKYRRVGDSMEVAVTVSTTGAPTAAALSVNLPSGFTIDTAKLSKNAASQATLGSATANDDGTRNYPGIVMFNSSTSVILNCAETTGSSASSIENDNPFTFGSGDAVSMIFTVPIAEWSGSGTVNVVQNDVEYAYNSSSSTTTNDSTSFAYGQSGALIRSITAGLRRSVSFQRAPQPGDQLTLEIWDGIATSAWLPVGIVSAGGFGLDYQNQNGSSYGLGFTTSLLGTEHCCVTFGAQAYASGATFGASGTSWAASGLNNFFWRVKKSSGGQAVGFGEVAQSSAGLVKSAGQLKGTNTNDVAAAGNVGEYMEGSQGDVSVTGANQYTDYFSPLALTAGDWDVTFQGWYSSAGTTGLAGLSIGISTNSGNNGAGLTNGVNAMETNRSYTTGDRQTLNIANYRVQVASGSTQNIYGKLIANYSGGTAPVFRGLLTARRRR